MFDRRQGDPLHTILPDRPHLRPDIMRFEHIEALRKREAERNNLRLQSVWQRTEKFANTVGAKARLCLRGMMLSTTNPHQSKETVPR